MLGHKSAAMTLDVYADLFEDDFTAVADRLEESVGKMWANPPTAKDPDAPAVLASSTFVLDTIAPPLGLEPSTVRCGGAGRCSSQ